MKISKLKKYWLSIFFLILSFACIALYEVIGSHVDEEGFVVEPFALIPLSWLFFLLGCLSACVSLFQSWRNRKR